MISRFKIKSFFFSFVFLTSILNFTPNKAITQENQISEDDFSNAEDAEEKRIKWGTDEFKLELIKEMSSANIALFIDEHLKSIKNPQNLLQIYEGIY